MHLSFDATLTSPRISHLSVALFQFQVQWSWEAISNRKFLWQNFIFDLHIKENENSMKLNTIAMSLLIKEMTFSSWESEQGKTWILIGKPEDVPWWMVFPILLFLKNSNLTLYRKWSLPCHPRACLRTTINFHIPKKPHDTRQTSKLTFLYVHFLLGTGLFSYSFQSCKH